MASRTEEQPPQATAASTGLSSSTSSSRPVPAPIATAKPVPKSAHKHTLSSAHVQESLKSSRSISQYRHVLAVHHRAKTSCLTIGATNAPSFMGFRNLMMLVLLGSNLRLMIENFMKYGVLICVRCHNYTRKDLVYGALLFFLVPCHLMVAFLIERTAAQQVKQRLGALKRAGDADTDGTNSKPANSAGGINSGVTETASTGVAPGAATPTKKAFDLLEYYYHSSWHAIRLMHALNATLNLAIATAVVYYYIHHPGIGTLCELHAVIVWLKVCSYALTNRDLRHASLARDRAQAAHDLPELYRECAYPRNITFGNLVYFWWAPTLIYQPVYPRTERIRWGFVALRAGEMLGLSILVWLASAQYAVPLLKNSLPLFRTLDYPSLIERVLKLSSISLFCWLAGFYAIFHSALNMLAEVLRFADRDFYQDWWNSATLREYWSSWNRPVYQFMKRHVFIPMVVRGVPVEIAQLAVFLFSGIMHEVLVGVPTHNIIGVAFLGMVLQLPLIFLTDMIHRVKFLNGPVIGNIIFWVSFVLVGQPLAALLYFFAWHAKYGSVSGNTSVGPASSRSVGNVLS